MKKLALLTALALLAACGAADQSVAPPPAVEATAAREATKLAKLVEEYFERVLELDPVLATSIGDLRYNDKLPVQISTQWLADALAVEQSHFDRLSEINVELLDADARLTYDIFRFGRKLNIDGAVFRDELLPISQFTSFPVQFGRLGSGQSEQPFANAQQYDDFLKRIDGFAPWVDQAIANMRQGVSEGIVQPKVLIEKALPQLASFIVDDPKQSLFYRPIENFPEAVNGADRKRLADAYAKAIREKVVPAYKRLHDYLKNEYLPKTRTTVGMRDLPQGDRWYAFRTRANTTTELSPAQIHDIGLKEMARIHAEMERVKGQVGFTGTLKEFMNRLRTDPRFVHKSAHDLIAGYSALTEQVTAALPKLFELLPKRQLLAQLRQAPGRIEIAGAPQ